MSSGPQSDAPPLEIDGMVAVVTGGAGGIGRGIVGALLRRGATVVIADVEQTAIDAAVADLAPLGKVSGHRTDVSDERSVADACRRASTPRTVAATCSTTTPGSPPAGAGKPWQQEPNDWRWCFGVNVFGTAFCTSEFVPRMIDGRRARSDRQHLLR